ncbi:hypothetical protein ACFZB6_20705 [Streptomyces syringium]|uniref:hypothetical protein n=1 Tax=Streptomyces syringium TaxID=76729 RepID=UPI0036E61216
MVVRQSKSWRKGVTWRIARCVVSYLVVYALAWIVIGLVAPRETDLTSDGCFKNLPLRESLLSYLESGITFFLLIGIPSIFIILLAGLARKDMDPPAFRAMVTALILLPTWFLLFGNIVEELLIQVAAQVVFATVVMPVPLIPQSEAQQAPKG